MRVQLFFLFLLICGFINAQEKRLALVIGNANYDKGALKNPVNDALLMKETLMSLGFDVILDTNLCTRNDLLKSINSFGERRKNYHVGFVYYAGHGVQIDGNNYILPTKEKYESKIDVKDNGVNVDRFMEFFEMIKNEVNILVLDACRNNPFEKNWTGSSRSLVDGLGLAPIPNSTGNIIAFSTSAGTTASDGKENAKNSSYCLSLVKNMMTVDLDLDQIFRNVRKEIRENSGGNQLPTVDNQYEGSDFYFIKSTYTDQILEIDSLIEANAYDIALEKVSSILAKDPNNNRVLLRRWKLNYLSNENFIWEENNASEFFNKKNEEKYLFLAEYYQYKGEIPRAINIINEALENNSNSAELLALRAALKTSNKQYFEALNDFNIAIEFDPLNEKYLFGRGKLNAVNLNNPTKAMDDFNFILSRNPNNAKALNGLGVCYENSGDYQKAILQFEKVINLEKTDPKTAAFGYSNLARIHALNNKYDLSLVEYSKAIELDPMNPDRYYGRANFYANQKDDFNKALLDFSKAIELEPNNLKYLYGRGRLFSNKNEFIDAIKDFEMILDIDSNSIDAINYLGIIYHNQGDFLKSIDQYSKGISIEIIDSVSASYCYCNRARVYVELNEYNEALDDFSHAIQLNPTDAELLYQRGLFYLKSTQEYEKALNDFSNAIDLDNSNKDYIYLRGLLLFDYLNQDKKAIEDFQKVLWLDSLDVFTINAIGNVYQKQGKLDLAIKEYEKGIKLEKYNPNGAAFCFSNRAVIYTEQHKLDMALKDYTKAIDLDPENPVRYYNRAEFFNNTLNRPYDALVDYSIGISIDSNATYIWWARGKLFSEKLKNQELAIRDFEYLLKLDSNDVSVLNWLGVLHGRLGEDSIEFEYYNRILRVQNLTLKENNEFKINLAWAYNNLAYTYQKENNNAKTLEYYGKAIENDPYEPLRHYERAWFNALYIGDYTSSLNDINNAIKFDEKNSYWLLKRAKINLISKNYNAAKKDFNKLVKNNSNSVSYTSELANFYSIINENELANFYFDKAQRIDSNSLVFLHLYTDHLIRKEIWGTAKQTAQKAISINIHDTIGYFQLGLTYLSNKNFVNALTSFVEAENIIEFSERIEEIDESDESQLFLSDIQRKISEIYMLLGEIELSCSYTNKAIQSLNNETRSKKSEHLKLLIDMKANCQN